MPNFKKRNSFSPLKERERRFINQHRPGSNMMLNSVKLDGFAGRTNWKELSIREKVRSSYQIEDSLCLSRFKSSTPTHKPNSPRTQHSPEKMSIFGTKELNLNSNLKKMEEDKNEQNTEDLEINSSNNILDKNSDDDSILSGEDNKSHHSEGTMNMKSSQNNFFGQDDTNTRFIIIFNYIRYYLRFFIFIKI